MAGSRGWAGSTATPASEAEEHERELQGGGGLGHEENVQWHRRHGGVVHEDVGEGAVHDREALVLGEVLVTFRVRETPGRVRSIGLGRVTYLVGWLSSETARSVPMSEA